MGAGDVSLLFRLLGDSSDLVDATDEAGQASDRLGDRFGKLQTATAAAGAAAGAALLAGLSASLDAESATDKLAAQIGAGSPMAEDAGRVAGSLYAQAYGESMSEVGDAVKTVLQSGLLSEDATTAEIEAVTAKAMDLAKAFDQDVVGATNAASQMIRTGLAENSAQAFDIMTRGFQQGVDKSGDFLDTLNEYGTQFRKLGLDGATATAMLAQGIRAGARDADVVADAIKEFSIRAIDGSEATASSFESLGFSATKMQDEIAAGGPRAQAALQLVLDRLRDYKDPAERSAIAVGLFGTQAEDLGDALFALNPATATLGNVAGAAEKMSSALNDNPSAKIEAFKRTVLQGMTEAAAGIITWVDEHRTAATTVGVAIAALTLLVGAHNVATTLAAAGGLRSWVMSTQLATAAQWLWNAALSANPIGLVIVAIAALVAGLVWFFTQTETGRRIFQVAMQGITTAFGWVWDKAQQGFGWVRSNWPLLLAIITGPIGLAVLAITRHWDTITGGLSAAKNKITSTASGMWDGIKNAFRAMINWVIGRWNSLRFSVPSFSAFGQTVGGFSLGVPAIPYMAAGGIVTGPTLAVLGDNRARREAVVPLERAGEFGFGGGGGPTINVYLTAGAIGSEDYLVRVVTDAVGQVVGQGRGTSAFAGVVY